MLHGDEKPKDSALRGDSTCDNMESGSLTSPQPLVEPFQVPLPTPDLEEVDWHHSTLLEMEEARERFVFSESFIVNFVSTSQTTPRVLSSTTPRIALPNSLLLEARTAILHALSDEVQISSIASPLRPPPLLGSQYIYSKYETAAVGPTPLIERLRIDKAVAEEPMVTLFCPYDHASGVIDSIVQSVAESEGIELEVLDSIVFAQGRDGPLGDGEWLIRATWYHCSSHLHTLKKRSKDFYKLCTTLTESSIRIFNSGKFSDSFAPLSISNTTNRPLATSRSTDVKIFHIPHSMFDHE